MSKIRRGGYIFVTWTGDYSPRHVHVYRDGKFIVKWDLDNELPMKGAAPGKVRKLIRALESKGYL